VVVVVVGGGGGGGGGEDVDYSVVHSQRKPSGPTNSIKCRAIRP